MTLCGTLEQLSKGSLRQLCVRGTSEAQLELRDVVSKTTLNIGLNQIVRGMRSVC